jgi:hypothetical protein
MQPRAISPSLGRLWSSARSRATSRDLVRSLWHGCLMRQVLVSFDVWLSVVELFICLLFTTSIIEVNEEVLCCFDFLIHH